ncbi:MAG: hypothetical protein U0235_31220 [Polyangiaceae bacterium]
MKAVQSIEDGPVLDGLRDHRVGAVSAVPTGSSSTRRTETCTPSRAITPATKTSCSTCTTRLPYALALYSVDPSIDGITLTDENGASRRVQAHAVTIKSDP